MPKLKSHSGAKKRFRKTASGKLKYRTAGQRHLLTGMSPNRGRRMRKAALLNPSDASRIRHMLQG